MELIHTTPLERVNEIKTNGLLSFKKDIGTILTATSENAYKPKYLPSFVDLNKCVYFFPMEEVIFSQGTEKLRALVAALMPQVVPKVNIDYFDKIIHIQTSSQDLDTRKLYLASTDKSEEIARRIYAFLKDNNIDIDDLVINNDHERLEKIIKSDSYKHYLQENKSCIKEYWDSMIPFNEYEKKWNKLPYNERLLPGNDPRNCLKYEILYFDDVPANKIEIKSDVFKFQDLLKFVQTLNAAKAN